MSIAKIRGNRKNEQIQNPVTAQRLFISGKTSKKYRKKRRQQNLCDPRFIITSRDREKHRLGGNHLVYLGTSSGGTSFCVTRDALWCVLNYVRTLVGGTSFRWKAFGAFRNGISNLSGVLQPPPR